MRGRTALLRHATAGVDTSADWQTFPLGSRVITTEGLPGTVVGFLAGPHAGSEEYEVTLAGGLGGGSYSPSELRPARAATAMFEPEAALELAADVRFASEDSDFRPDFTEEDGTDGPMGDSVLKSHERLFSPLAGIGISNLNDLVSSELETRTSDEASEVWSDTAALNVSVSHVGLVGSLEPVRRILASSEVAGVENIKLPRVFDDVGEPPSMCSDHPRISRFGQGSVPEGSISKPIAPSSPGPTNSFASGRVNFSEIPLHAGSCFVGHDEDDDIEIRGHVASEFYPELEDVLVERPPPQHALPVTAAKNAVPSVAGMVVKAEDTGRVLLIQRSNGDSKDPAGGLWEFPGGHMEENEAPWDAGKREWEEETGHRWPEGRYGGHWISPNGIYQGHVWAVPSEDSVKVNLDPEDRHVLNPDDPDGDNIEVMAWWDPDHLPKMPALRPEVKTSDWKLIKAAILNWYITPGDGTLVAGPFVTHADAQDLLDDDVYDSSEYRVVTGAFPERISPHLQNPEPGRPDNPHATEKSRLSPEARVSIDERINKYSPDPAHPLTQDRMSENIKSIYRDAVKRNPEAVEEGHHWYEHAHDFAHGLHHQYGSISPRHSAGVVAALSPQLDWRENQVQAEYIHKHLADPQSKLRLAPEHVEAAHQKAQLAASNPRSPDYGHEPIRLQPGKRFADMGHEEAAHALKTQAQYTDHLSIPEHITRSGKPALAQFSNGEGAIAKAIRIHRGEDPDTVLRGHKVRSFFNNINNPHDPHPDVTMDTHAVSLAAHHKLGATSPAIKQMFSSGTRKSENIMGTYAHFADAYRQAHHELVQSGEMPKDSHPHALQATTWLHWRDLTVKRGKFYDTDHEKFPEQSGLGYQREKLKRQRQVLPVAAHLDHEHDPGERLDPTGGPPDDEDPDLRDTEWNPYDPYGEGDEEDPDDDDATPHEALWHVTASWQDVQAKAVRIRKEGGVRIISSSPAIVVAEVRGDQGVYQTEIQYVPGHHQVALWTCGCPWSSYSWGRTGRWKKYEGRVCSHTLALIYETQSRGMFGREVKEDYNIPTWRKDVELTNYEKPPPGPWMMPNIPTSLYVAPRAASKSGGFLQPGFLVTDDMRLLAQGAQQCQCCAGVGEHSSGRECYTCDGSGYLGGTEKQATCDSSLESQGLGTLEPDGVYRPFEAELKDEPEPALPFTTSDEEEEALAPVTASVPSAETRSWLMQGTPSKDTSDIAAAARAFLAKEGAKTFTRAEQVALINEGESEGVTASNLDLLDLEGTHYALLEEQLLGMDDDENWLS